VDHACGPFKPTPGSALAILGLTSPGASAAGAEINDKALCAAGRVRRVSRLSSDTKSACDQAIDKFLSDASDTRNGASIGPLGLAAQIFAHRPHLVSRS
jgi:hypothetical protein